MGARKLRELPQFKGINMVLGNLRRSFNGSFHAFDFDKYGFRYLAKLAYRFNRRFSLASLPERLLVAAVQCRPHAEAAIRATEDACQ